METGEGRRRVVKPRDSMAGEDTSFAVTLVADGRPQLRQNENGPCFVIALVNALLLNSDSDSDLDSEEDRAFRRSLVEMATSRPAKQVPLDTVYTFLVERFLQKTADTAAGTDDVGRVSSEHILDTLPMLDSGLLINPAFNNIEVSDFGEYSASITHILDLFGLKLYHGFIMPPELLSRLEESGVKPTFDSCQDYLVSRLEDSSTDVLAKDVDTFLANNRTEITPTGCQLLIDSLDDNQIFLFFRNDHFNTCIKHANSIYSLVTDIGYSSQPDIVWQPLSIYDEGDFFNATFEISKIDSNPSPAHDVNVDPAVAQQEEADMLLAKQLQIQEDNEISKNLQETFDKEAKSKAQTPISKKPVNKMTNQSAKTIPKKPVQSSKKPEAQMKSKMKNKSKSGSKAQSKSSNSQSCVIV